MAKSLLIVDDSATMRKIVMRSVRMSGLEFDPVDEAENGAAALEKLKASPADLILCDINMPEMNGLEMVKKIRTEMPELNSTKIVMVSSESAEDLVQGALDNGANDYITKPFTPEKFQQKLEPLL